MPVTFLVVLPFTQLMVVLALLALGLVAAGVFAGAAGAAVVAWVIFAAKM